MTGDCGTPWTCLLIVFLFPHRSINNVFLREYNHFISLEADIRSIFYVKLCASAFV